MMRLYRIPLSTNVERVAMALAHKGIEVESIEIDPDDRSRVRSMSGQDLVPVLEDDGKVIADSMEIVRYLEDRHPARPLYPTDPARRTEMLIFIDWFNRVWKRPPNEIFVEMGKPAPDRARIERLGKAMTASLDLFEGMLSGRDYLMGEFSAADCAAFPFVKFAHFHPQGDPYLFHQILVEWMPLAGRHERLKGWLQRVDKHPRA
jgi:glutathione S-transferase